MAFGGPIVAAAQARSRMNRGSVDSDGSLRGVAEGLRRTPDGSQRTTRGHERTTTAANAPEQNRAEHATQTTSRADVARYELSVDTRRVELQYGLASSSDGPTPPHVSV